MLDAQHHFAPGDLGTYSAKHNWFTKANAYYFDYSLNYNDSLDYLFWLKSHKPPLNTPETKIVQLKAANSWYWHYLKGSWNLDTGTYQHDGYYNELSDHYPVQAQYLFE